MSGVTGVGVAIVGYGYAARTFHAPLIGATPGLSLAWAVARSEASKAQAARDGVAVAGLDAVLADPQVRLVVIATPSGEHVEPATRALLAGKAVVIEKPMAATAADAEALADLAAREGQVLSVFHNRRWDADFLSLKALIDRGGLGEVVELVSTWDRYRPEVRDRWRERAGPAGGLWYDLGAHLLDQALQLFGKPRTIWADIGAQRPGAAAADYFHVRLGYGSGPRAILQGRSLALAAAPRFVVHGTAGSYVKEGFDPQEAALQAGVRPGAPGWGVDPQPGVIATAEGTSPEPGVPGDYRRFYAGMRDAILDGRDPPVTGREAAEVVRLLGRAEESAAKGSVLTL